LHQVRRSPGVSIEADQVRHPVQAGSATDALARIADQELEQTLGQPIIVVQPGPTAHWPPAGEAFATRRLHVMFGTNARSPSCRTCRRTRLTTSSPISPVTYLGDGTFFIVVNPRCP
jgi:tripartite-type tricarboxylate transporter receptor subunit TctC